MRALLSDNSRFSAPRLSILVLNIAICFRYSSVRKISWPYLFLLGLVALFLQFTVPRFVFNPVWRFPCRISFPPLPHVWISYLLAGNSRIINLLPLSLPSHIHNQPHNPWSICQLLSQEHPSASHLASPRLVSLFIPHYISISSNPSLSSLTCPSETLPHHHVCSISNRPSIKTPVPKIVLYIFILL